MVMNHGANPQYVRRINAHRVLSLIRGRAAISRAEIARLTQLSKPSVTDIVRDLEKKKLVVEVGIADGKKTGGRKPTLLRFNPAAGGLIGVEVDRYMIKGVLTDLAGQVIFQTLQDIPRKAGMPDILRDLVSLIKGLGKRNKYGPVIGAGIAFPGYVDSANGVVLHSSVFDCKDLSLKSLVQERCSLPAVIDDNSRAGAYGEYTFGAGQNRDPVVYLYIGSGLGAGIFTRNEFYRGRHNFAGEIGHVQVVENGLPCGCGSRGCLETLISEEGVIQAYKNTAGKTHPLGKGTWDLERIFKEGLEGHSVAHRVIKGAAKHVAKAINLVSCCFDPEIIVLGGSVITCGGEAFFDQIKQAVEGRINHLADQKPRIEMTVLKEQAGTLGAAAMAFQEIFMKEWLHQ